MTYTFGIRAIKILNQSINIPDDLDLQSFPGKVRVEKKFNIDVQEDLSIINIVVYSSIFLKLNTETTGTKVFTITVANTFNVPNLKDYVVKESQFEIDPKFLKLLINMSIDHTRGVQVVFTNNTPLERILIDGTRIDPENDLTPVTDEEAKDMSY